MTETENSPKATAGYWTVFLALCLMASLTLNVHQCHSSSGDEYFIVDSDTVTVAKDTYHVDPNPEQLEPEKVVGHVSIPVLPSSSGIGMDKSAEKCLYGRNGEYKNDSVCLFEQNGSNKNDAPDSITLNIVQRTFGDSTYTAYVSGPKVDNVGPKLDSIRVRQRFVWQSVTNTVTKPPNKKHFHFGIVAGGGVSLTTGRPDAFAGIGVMYEL